jgi:hypothetical protein
MKSTATTIYAPVADILVGEAVSTTRRKTRNALHAPQQKI